MFTDFNVLKFTKLSGKDDKLLKEMFSVSSFFSSDNSLGKLSKIQKDVKHDKQTMMLST